MNGWNFADVWEVVAATIPQEVAQVQGSRSLSWAETERRAAGLAATLVVAGLTSQDKVALYLYNSPEYMEAAFACMKASLVPVNTNYRYGAEELEYLWDNADIGAVIFSGTFSGLVERLRDRCGRIRLWIHVDDGTTDCPDWAVPYAQACSREPNGVPGAARSGDDLILIYTGGTTGRPKGVMWCQHDLYRVSDTANDPEEMDLDGVGARITGAHRRPVGLAAAPLMHGTGFVFAGTILSRGGTLVHQEGRRFDAAALLDTMTAERVTALCIVGEAFGRPIVDALDAEPDRWDLSPLEAVSSAGMVWRADSKRRLLRHAPGAILVDLLNSSEASGIGRSVTSSRREAPTGTFRLGANSLVIGPDGEEVRPGSGVEGQVAVRGHLPLGYYKDPAKTAEVFREIRGVRYSLPGDHATVAVDGTIVLLGRGSGVVNTGGEKVYPEEVEEVLREDASVRDVIVVGVPDDRMGEVVAALVELVPGKDGDLAALAVRAGTRLASYKVPRHLVAVDSVGRTPSGKADYPAVKRRIQDALQTPTTASVSSPRGKAR